MCVLNGTMDKCPDYQGVLISECTNGTMDRCPHFRVSVLMQFKLYDNSQLYNHTLTG